MLAKLYAANPDDLNVQAKYLDVLSDVDFNLAKELRNKLMPNFASGEDDDLI